MTYRVNNIAYTEQRVINNQGNITSFYIVVNRDRLCNEKETISKHILKGVVFNWRRTIGETIEKQDLVSRVS